MRASALSVKALWPLRTDFKRSRSFFTFFYHYYYFYGHFGVTPIALILISLSLSFGTVANSPFSSSSSHHHYLCYLIQSLFFPSGPGSFSTIHLFSSAQLHRLLTLLSFNPSSLSLTDTYSSFFFFFFFLTGTLLGNSLPHHQLCSLNRTHFPYFFFFFYFDMIFYLATPLSSHYSCSV